MVCNAGLYYIHVRKRTCGDTVLKNILTVVCYFVALMLTVLLCAEFA